MKFSFVFGKSKTCNTLYLIVFTELIILASIYQLNNGYFNVLVMNTLLILDI